ncbi:MAG: hypothetical protein A3F67_05160 [Verrucomicrobia bacterium RIFCSPHIGHO2_12_FULL_41_10]|nr:MAG: hypothetical protein A3F67_05160 [Verrucomicrobia bacterium RIFCSPHIGHO2_12_FULL_41_10]
MDKIKQMILKFFIEKEANKMLTKVLPILKSKAFMAGIALILLGLGGLLQGLSNGSLTSFSEILHSEALKQMLEGLSVVGLRHAVLKAVRG